MLVILKSLLLYVTCKLRNSDRVDKLTVRELDLPGISVID